MWKLVETIEDARVWCEICDLADPESYKLTATKDEHELRSKQILQYYEDRPGKYEYWIYDADGGLCALSVKETVRNDAPYLEYTAYCAVGFAEDALENWRIAYKIAGEKCREIKAQRGILKSGGNIPKTPVGKCLAAVAQEHAWEQKTLEDKIPGGDTWRIEFDRTDETGKPADESLFEKVRDTTVVLDPKIVEEDVIPK